MLPVPEHVKELARRLAAAYTSHRMGAVALDYTYKTYVKDREPKQYWIDLAELVLDPTRGAEAQRERDSAEEQSGPVQ